MSITIQNHSTFSFVNRWGFLFNTDRKFEIAKKMLLLFSLLYISYNIKNRRYKIETFTKRIIIALSSKGLNFFHKGAYFLTQKTGLGDSNYHTNGMRLATEKGTNAYFKLIGSTSRVFICTTDVQGLIPSVNRPRKALINDKSRNEILEKVKQLQIGSPLSYFKFNYKKLSSLEEGVCLGMVQVFISEYFKWRSKGTNFRDAAIIAAQSLAKGANVLACALQQIHHISELNREKFDEQYPVEKIGLFESVFRKFTARRILGYYMLKSMTDAGCLWTFSRSGKKLTSLTDGVYDIGTGYEIIEGIAHPIKGNRAHSSALLIENKSFLIFDSNIGLFAYPDPDRFFEVIRITDEGILCINRIYPPKCSHLLKRR